MESLMEEVGLTWSYEEVVTEDGYHLTMFRITGDVETGPFEITKPPLLAIHPMLMNAEYWVTPEVHMFAG